MQCHIDCYRHADIGNSTLYNPLPQRCQLAFGALHAMLVCQERVGRTQIQPLDPSVLLFCFDVTSYIVFTVLSNVCYLMPSASGLGAIFQNKVLSCSVLKMKFLCNFFFFPCTMSGY